MDSNGRFFPSSIDDQERRNSNSSIYEKVIQRRKFMKIVKFLNEENQRLQNELAREKQRRTVELSSIIKSMICIESKLKMDKNLINQRLLKKDSEISQLNRALHMKFNAKSESFVLECLLCINCKKKLYNIDTRDNWSQTIINERLLNDRPTAEFDSSSDAAVSSSFNEYRQCFHYTNKRTFSKFRERSRLMEIIDCGMDNSAKQTITKEKIINSGTNLHLSKQVCSSKADSLNNVTWRKNQNQSSDVENNFVLLSGYEIFSPEDGLSTYGSKVNLLSKSKEFLEVSPKFEFESSTDNWYASDGEENQAVRTNFDGYNVTVNPVLECVNQILMQESTKESNNTNNSIHLKEVINPNFFCSQYQNSSSGIKQKDNIIFQRQDHFSPKNSILNVSVDNYDNEQDDLGGRIPLSLQSESVTVDQTKDNILHYESIYSNEYKTISTDTKSNLYIDMGVKVDTQYQEVRDITNYSQKQPPALPPKPPNLIKFKRKTKIQQEKNEPEVCPTIDDTLTSTSSEPEYCSISEINPTVVTVQEVADVHKELNYNETEKTENLSNSKKSKNIDDIQEMFANIPKLPNVTAIIAPLSKTNLTIQSRHVENNSKSPLEFRNKHIPNILTEINKRMTTKFLTTPKKNISQFHNEINCLPTSSKRLQSLSPVVKLPINSSPVVEQKLIQMQGEFDWYNLDAEYEKSSCNHQDIVKISDVNSIDEKIEEFIKPHGVEYNLDKEFSLAGNSDIIKEI